MRHIHTEPLSDLARSILDRNSKPIANLLRPVGLNPEQEMEAKLEAEKRFNNK